MKWRQFRKLIITSIGVFTFFFGYSQPKFDGDLLDNPKQFAPQLEKLFKTYETRKVDPRKIKGKVVYLTNGYAQSKIVDGEKWTFIRETNEVKKIDIVYTKYPKDKEFWLTNYHELLANRLKELFRLDPDLNDKNIQWNIALQTQCESNEEAKKMFHGFILHYEPLPKGKKKKTEEPEEQVNSAMSGYTTLKRYVKYAGSLGDSCVFKVLDRNNNWKDVVIVTDFSGSMYTYAPQVLLWHYEHIDKSNVKAFCFFNDGDSKYDNEKIIGQTGGIYFAKADNMAKVVRMYNSSMRNGMGGDIPENDIEALLKSKELFSELKELVLVADNSPYRDYELIPKLNIPVRVILVDAVWGINPQYLNLAYKTKGSFHTLKGDYIEFWKNLKDDILEIEGQQFKYDAGRDEFICKDIRDCEYLDQKTLEQETKTLEDLKSKPIYKRMHKDKSEKPGIWSFLKRVFG